ncbi:MFS transporter (plasmid) [Entomospira entomophila]|uniref:MFS transporter n=1 Tax=Entomospira entomophila TaxID=2719988 RepID=A0A968GCZ1_9SPIO|nr:MFS transporter [Entomospira entomophilus]NIZ41318.1 MFS transporter [Entomospira entomophilus]WDI36269.1 MFS transporter [Entomospira entomophilus]
MSIKKSYFQLILLVLSAGSIYPLVYLRTNFQEPLLEVLDISIDQLSTLYSMLGMMFVIGYLPSGWLADRFSAKWLIVFSLISTSLLGIWLSTIPSYSMIQLIFIGFGFSTVFTFWSSLMKAVKLLTTPETEGKFFGILDGGRGLVEAILGTIAISIFVAISKHDTSQGNTEAAMRGVIFMYVVTLILLAVAISLILPDTKQQKESNQQDSKQASLLVIKQLLKMKEVWLISAIIFTGYTVFWTVYYFSGFLVVNQHISVELAGTITVIVLWMRPIGGIGGGIVADKIGKTKLLAITLLFSSLGLLVIALIPLSNLVVFTIIILIGLSNYVIRGVYWSLLQFLKINAALLGTAIGLISFLGYLPDVILPTLSGQLYKQFTYEQANSLYFIISASVGIIGLILTVYFYFRIEKKEITT